MTFHEYKNYDATGLAELIRRKEVQPSELVETAFSQLHQVNPELNITTHQREEAVKKEANQFLVQEAAFSGVPILMKNISQAIEGEKLTSGSRLLQNHVEKRDNYFVKKFREAGFLFMGHTNSPEFGLKNITEPTLYGPTRNPWNPAYSPGGSSGGAAAAIASGVVPMAGASDGGGSIRIPASFSGLVGLKPTRGRTPVGPGVGRQWQGASINFVLTKTVRDAAAMLDQLQVVEPHAAFQTPLYEAGYQHTLSAKLPQLRIAFTTDSPANTPVSDDAKKAVLQFVRHLEQNGHIVEEKTSPVDGVQLMRDYYVMNSGEMNSVIRGLEKTMGTSLTAEDMEIESWLLHQAGKSVSAADYSDSLASWDRAAETMSIFHQSYDFYISPAAAFHAPKVGELTMTAQKEQEFKERMAVEKEKQSIIYDMFLPSLTYTPFTQLANLTGQPAISLPLYVTDNGLPIGVQVMAGKGGEHRLLQLAYEIENSDLWKGMQGNPYFS
ncbi:MULTISPECIES: amidase family protein [Oceanobacillus]|uniref:Amidase family protein n=1 Tax=Oceanobacillus aidingensis TaxID=645964 RepID=A0ABV9JVN1_9BACI|nr:amidase family protein [Oceanobacillus oncorhynchi]MDM8102077.1 amidase family protein [Oceanobacillus oncorhynchi]